MGTPAFAVSSLAALVEGGYEVVGAVSQPDKPKGRGHKLAPPPVKVYASEHGVEVFQPETLRSPEFMALLARTAPDLIVVAAYGKILPEAVLNFPKYGCINVHASLLPKYRGAAPIQRCIMDGQTETGVTIMMMAKGIDTGDMLLRRALEIGRDETADSLHDRLAALGAKLLCEAVDKIAAGTAVRTPQDDALSTYAPMIDKSTARIDWTASAGEIVNLVRAMNSWPLAYTYLCGKMMKIARASACGDDSASTGAAPGQVIGYRKEQGLLVKCGEGVLCVEQVKFEGKRLMSIQEYLQGHTIAIGSVLTGQEES